MYNFGASLLPGRFRFCFRNTACAAAGSAATAAVAAVAAKCHNKRSLRHFHLHSLSHVDRDSVVDVATTSGLNGQRIESQWWEIFRN